MPYTSSTWKARRINGPRDQLGELEISKTLLIHQLEENEAAYIREEIWVFRMRKAAT